jgi:hypothetical protein
MVVPVPVPVAVPVSVPVLVAVAVPVGSLVVRKLVGEGWVDVALVAFAVVGH